MFHLKPKLCWEHGKRDEESHKCPLCVTRTKVLSPDALCTAERVLPPPAQPKQSFLVLFLVFPGFCCCGVQCLSCTQLVWLSLHWPSQTMFCSPSSLTVFPPIMPLGSCPWCVYVSICFLYTHKSCPGFYKGPLQGLLQPGWGQDHNSKGRWGGPRRDAVSGMGYSVPFHLPAANTVAWREAQRHPNPCGSRESGGRWVCGMGQCCAPCRAMDTWHRWPTTLCALPLPGLLSHSQTWVCRRQRAASSALITSGAGRSKPELQDWRCSQFLWGGNDPGMLSPTQAQLLELGRAPAGSTQGVKADGCQGCPCSWESPWERQCSSSPSFLTTLELPAGTCMCFSIFWLYVLKET